MRKISLVRTLVPAMLLLAGAAHAANVYMKSNMAMNTTWDTGTYWSDGNPAAAGNAYFVGRDANGAVPADVTYPPASPQHIELRTPAGTTPVTFPGDSMTIDTSGTLKLKTDALVTIGDLRFKGVRSCLNCGDTFIMPIGGGKVTNNASPMWLYVGDAAGRVVVFNSQLTGSGNILIDAKTNQSSGLELNNDANNFTGIISTDTGSLIVDTPKSLGGCSLVSIGGNGLLTVKADVQATSTFLDLYSTGKVNLDHNIRVKAARIAGVNLVNNTYTATQLAALYPGNVINGGGSLMVGTPVPRLSVNPGTTTVTFSNLNIMIQAGDKTSQTVTLTNSGNLDLNFTKQGSEPNQGIVLSGSPLYKIKSVSPATTAPLAPGGVVTVTLEFSGATAADYVQGGNNAKAATLDIYSNATGMPKYSITLAGSTTVPVELSGFSAQ